MFALFRKKRPIAPDALIRTIYGTNPPSKSADLERSVTIAYQELLLKQVPLSAVKQIAGELFNGPIPFSTHDLATATAAAFFKTPRLFDALYDCQLIARRRITNWAVEGKVAGPLAKSFEDDLYAVYKRNLSEGSARRKSMREWFAYTPPWNRLPSIIIDAILTALHR
jgi:hypothetical protein